MKTTRYFLDTEFVENGPHHPVRLISIGIRAEDGREYYAQSWDGVVHATGNQWLIDNVFPHLTHMTFGPEITNPDGTGTGTRSLSTCNCTGPLDAEGSDCPWRDLHQMAQEIQAFCDPKQYGRPEFWAYYADYDWVVFCQIFGSMLDLPDGFPMYCRDIKQEADRLEGWIRSFNSQPDYELHLPTQERGEHNALEDARWNEEALAFLNSMSGGFSPEYQTDRVTVPEPYRIPPATLDDGDQK